MAKHDNDQREIENIDLDVVAASDITFHVISATAIIENATTIFLDKGSMGCGIILRPSDNVSIVSIGGKTFRDPIPVSTAGFIITKIRDFSQLVIRTLNANTHIDLVVM